LIRLTLPRRTALNDPLRAVALLVLTVAPLGVVEAADGIAPRTPATFPGAACLTVHDRSVEPIFTFGYKIPYEDTRLTADEVAESRTHQFLALCRGHHPQAPLPLWISEADVLDAASKGHVVPGDVEPNDILELAEQWKGCFVRITPDQPRRPITFEAASEPVLWDTSGLPAGPYYIFGYTWHPYYNMWSPWRGVVKLIDGDPDAAPPALAITNFDENIYPDQSATIVGCVDAVDGATITASWSFTDAIAWKPFAVDVPVDGDQFAVDFAPPPETVGVSVMIRVDVTDPMDRTSTAYMADLVTVIEVDTGSTSDTSDTSDTADSDTCGGSFLDVPECPDSSSSGDTTHGDASGGATGTSTGEGSGSAGSATADGDSDSDGDGCVCAANRRTPGGLALFGALLLLARRRRPNR
jgi:hypothetical protein